MVRDKTKNHNRQLCHHPIAHIASCRKSWASLWGRMLHIYCSRLQPIRSFKVENSVGTYNAWRKKQRPLLVETKKGKKDIVHHPQLTGPLIDRKFYIKHMKHKI